MFNDSYDHSFDGRNLPNAIGILKKLKFTQKQRNVINAMATNLLLSAVQSIHSRFSVLFSSSYCTTCNATHEILGNRAIPCTFVVANEVQC